MNGEAGATLLWLAGFLVLALVLLALAVLIVLIAFQGAVVLFAMAAAQGFVGLVAFAAAWVFLFPVMAPASLSIGLFIAVKEGQLRTRLQHRNKPAGQPPSDLEERHKWANRLPPYDE